MTQLHSELNLNTNLCEDSEMMMPYIQLTYSRTPGWTFQEVRLGNGPMQVLWLLVYGNR